MEVFQKTADAVNDYVRVLEESVSIDMVARAFPISTPRLPLYYSFSAVPSFLPDSKSNVDPTMKLAWELHWQGAVIEPIITCLSWTGDVNHGQIAAGSESGVVGITLTDFHPPSAGDTTRHNFNLRGHHSSVSTVTWNHAKGKLASSDQSGVIYVWSRNDDRWSVELVNERGVKVKDVSWSPCGGAALICYEDNFVLIGSASGQRIWSNNYPSNQPVNCGVWAGARFLVVGLATGHIHILSDDGSSLNERKVTNDEIIKLVSPAVDERIALLTDRGSVIILRTFDQVEPDIFNDDEIAFIEWTPDGKLLAAVTRSGCMYILDSHGRLIHRDEVVVDHYGKVTAMTWAHDGRVLVVAEGGRVHVARVLLPVPSLYTLVSYQVWRLIGADSSKIIQLDIPQGEKCAIRAFEHHMIRCRVPAPTSLRQFVSSVSDSRIHCTIKCLPSSSRHYVLSVEHMGGLVPILLGRQVSRVVPHFQISLHPSAACPVSVLPPGRSAQVEDAASCLARNSAPQRMSLWRRSKRRIRSLVSRRVAPLEDTRMAHVSSNVCCTRFEVTAVVDGLPCALAQVSYKTSVLHLQPRQMTVKLVDTEDDGGEEELALLNSVVGECCALREVILQGEEGSSREEQSWHDEVDSLEFIDGAESDDRNALMRHGSLRSRAEVGANLSRLAEIANRRSGHQSAKSSLSAIRHELRELEKKVEEIEKKAGCEDVRRELKAVTKSVQKMKNALAGGQNCRRIFTLHNKTPFWNEHNQVYQLDFGGRVTQESAKNFQIELDGSQSLQFGRIEGGAYTLDFRRPFTAVQAFAIALASITQRLK